MSRFSHIISIWIFCVSCLFKSQWQVPLVAAVPFEYIEDHEQLSYDLDTEQSKVKYDTRLLSEQLLKEQPNPSDTLEDYDGGTTTPGDEDDLQPHGRAASCHTGGHKYTHGQKVPRLDPCEVCLCMDGEIFCWWEMCDKKSTTPSGEVTTSVRLDVTTQRSDKYERQQKLHKQQQQQRTQQKQHQNEAQQRQQQQQQQQQTADMAAKAQSMKLLSKKKILPQAQTSQQQSDKHNQRSQQNQQKQKQKQKLTPQQQQQHKHTVVGGGGGHASKILSFPENLPSLLYYDYNTEEHQHHQHQHRQQHLKHQQQLQRMKEEHERQRQRQRQHDRERQREQEFEMERLEEANYGSGRLSSTVRAQIDGNELTRSSVSYSWPWPASSSSPLSLIQPSVSSSSSTSSASASASVPASGSAPAPAPAPGSVSLAMAMDIGMDMGTGMGLASAGNENVYDEPEIDSDILPEPPTKRPKAPSTLRPKVTGLPVAGTESSKKSSLLSLPLSTEMGASAAPEGDGNVAQLKGVSSTGGAQADDAFHRWLTSTETNNSNNSNNKHNRPDDCNSGGDGEAEVAAIDTYFRPAVGKNGEGVATSLPDDAAELDWQSPQYNKSAELGSNCSEVSSSDYNGSVVNIDILLTATDEHERQREEQIQQESIILEADLISSPDSVKTMQSLPSDAGRATATATATATPATTPPAPASASASAGTTVPTTSVTTATVATSTFGNAATTPSPTAKQCNVMGTLYNIGDVLPQDTGNCLQCVCIEGTGTDDTPRVTCSPHNCPPLVLPDLFDVNGY